MRSKPDHSRDRLTAIAFAGALFFLSGAAALVYQVIWQRILGIVSGVHIYSVTIIVAAFMAGLGLGSLAGGRIADQLTRRRAVAGFAACEFAIGLFAWMSPWLYYDVAYLRLGFLVEWQLALPVLHLALLLFPTLLMGASLPLLARGLVPDATRAAGVIGTLYGVNTLGAAIGAWASVWWLIARLGFVGTIRTGTLLNFAAAAGAVVLMRRIPDDLESLPPESNWWQSAGLVNGVAPLGLAAWSGIYALSGFVALSLEILWFRVLDVSIKSSPFTFGHLLGLFLFFLGVGSVVGAWAAPRARRPDLVFLWGQTAIGFLAAASIALVCHLPADSWAMAVLYRYWSTDSAIRMVQLRDAWHNLGGLPLPEVLARALQVYVALPLALLAVPTFLMGLTYPFVQRSVQTDLRQVGWRTGVIQAANIAGCMLGSLLTGGLLLTVLGSAATLRLIVLAAMVFGLIALARGSRRRRTGAVVGILAGGVTLAAAVPSAGPFWARFHGSHEDALIVAEDASSVVALQRHEGPTAVLRVNGAGHSDVPPLGAHAILGAVPVLIHPAAEDVLVIGLGTWDTAWAAGSAPELQRADVYEIAVPEYDVMRRLMTSTDLGFPLAAYATKAFEDPRIRLTFSDGRLALRLRGQRYDVIEVDALEPYMAYSGNLYSREFFELAASALKPGGIVCTYAPTERTQRTIVAAFPWSLHFSVPGDRSNAPWTALRFAIGSNDQVTYDRDRVLARLASEPFQRYWRAAGMERQANEDVRGYLEQATVVEIGPLDRERFIRGDINTDLFPRDEYEGASPGDPLAQNFFLIHFYESTVQTDVTENVGIRAFQIGSDRRAVLYVHPPSEVRYRLTPQPGAVLGFGLALSPDVWSPDKGDGVTFEVRAEADGVSSTLLSRYIDPKHDPADRRWHDVTVDLSAYASRPITLVFTTTGGPSGNTAFDWAGFSDPALETR